ITLNGLQIYTLAGYYISLFIKYLLFWPECLRKNIASVEP
ncbi:amino acid ABC transporter permease, partial [Salmonella enterica subsp. enterica serovar Typhimurium]